MFLTYAHREVCRTKTEIIRITDTAQSAAEIAAAGESLRRGQLVAFRTETVYGLGANAGDEVALAHLCAVKQRPLGKPFTLLLTRDMIPEYAMITPAAERLMARYCPGPLTLVLPKRSGTGTVGVRVPDDELAATLIAAAGIPLAAPSANLSGHTPPVTAEEVRRELDGLIPLILDGGACRLGISSTVVDCCTAVLRVLRRGAVYIDV